MCVELAGWSSGCSAGHCHHQHHIHPGHKSSPARHCSPIRYTLCLLSACFFLLPPHLSPYYSSPSLPPVCCPVAFCTFQVLFFSHQSVCPFLSLSLFLSLSPQLLQLPPPTLCCGFIVVVFFVFFFWGGFLAVPFDNQMILLYLVRLCAFLRHVHVARILVL